MDGLVGQGIGVCRTGMERGAMASGAAELREQLLALQRYLIVDVSTRRYRQRAHVEADGLPRLIAELVVRISARGRLVASGHRRCTRAFSEQRGRNADVADERARRLLHRGGLIGLPTKATQHGRLFLRVPDIVRHTGHAVFVRSMDICQDLFFRNGFEQTQADHARPGAGRNHQLVARFAVVPAVDGIARFLQRKPSYSIDGWNYGEPSDELMISPRTGPSVIGLGLLEAVPEEEILANVHAADEDGVAGVANYVWDAEKQATVLGRFGWKANQPSTMQQTAGAFVGDIGITSALFRKGTCTSTMTACNEATSGADPDYELSDQAWQAVGFYMRSLAVPARRNVDDQVALKGEQLFTKFGCAACHRTTLHTGSADADALANQTIHPYTDLLLHDMGPELADGRPDYQATGSQWRTPPLWGLGLLQKVNQHSFLLHDARARGFAEAILWHGGEGAKARENFRLAESSERDALLKFLESL